MSGDITDPQTLNKYTYVRDNPVNLTDPSGAYLRDPYGFDFWGSSFWGGGYGGAIDSSGMGDWWTGAGSGVVQYTYKQYTGFEYDSEGEIAGIDSQTDTFQTYGSGDQGGSGSTSQSKLPPLAECTLSTYFVVTSSFVSSGPGTNGVFTGYGIVQGSSIAPGASNFTVTNNVNTYNLSGMQQAAPSPPPLLTIGFTPTESPYTNFTASGLSASLTRLSQLTELGNSLALITGAVTPAQAKAMDDAGHPPGQVLYDCVAAKGGI